MNLMHFNEIADITDLCEVKTFFGEGWFLIDTYKSKSTDGETMHYVLGQPMINYVLEHLTHK